MIQRLIEAICRSSYRRPYTWLGVTLLLTLPAFYEIRKIRLDTNLSRLLPKNSPAVVWNDKLEKTIGGDGGYFSVLFEGEPREKLLTAIEEAATQIQALPEVQSVETRRSLDFYKNYRYLLIPSDVLQKIFDAVVTWKAEASPFGMKLEDAAPASSSSPGGSDQKDVEENFRQYSNLSEQYESADKRVMGLMVRPLKGLTNLAATQKLFFKLDAIAQEVGKNHGLWAGIHGSLRSKIDEFNQISSDINRSGLAGTLAIAGILILTFRSFLALPILLYPIGIGLIWSFALVPLTVGDLNTITSFLAIVLLGMGQEWAIHLLKRFQGELLHKSPEESLIETFASTGRSIVTSGFTTATGMIVLSFSNFRGFSEYGVISACSMMMIFLAMFTVMPATMLVGHRWGWLRGKEDMPSHWSLVPGRIPTYFLSAAVLAATGLMILDLGFDYDFSSLKAEVSGVDEVKARHRQVFAAVPSHSVIYVAKDLATLDAATQVLERAKSTASGEAILGPITSIRRFAPPLEEAAARYRILAELQDRLQGRWIRRVKDEEKKRWIEDIRDFKPPAQAPTLADLPPELTKSLTTRDGSGEFILSTGTASKGNDGRMSITFMRTLYALKMPEGVRGPTGSKLVLAEILEMVTSEAPWLVGLTFLGIFCLVLLDRQGSLKDAFWILLPLVCGIVLTLGMMVALGWKLNFFNMVVLPSLIGMSVDSGVHYYRRWEEVGHDVRLVQLELFVPMTGSALTTVMGYAGTVLAHHEGLRSIAHFAILGIACCWFSSVALMPGILKLRELRRHV